ncbi:MAG: peroxiredoxin-like family protein, partial [Bryobacteraceae bacterium]
MPLHDGLIPGCPVPPLQVELVGGGIWRLAEERPERFSMIVFYRGRHCHVCSNYLAELESKLDEFSRRGVNVVAISCDTGERAAAARQDWKLGRLRIGHSLDLAYGRDWGLYITEGKYITRNGLREPDLFTEPALYLIDPSGKLYFGVVQTMPFARPHFTDLLYAVDFAIDKSYP